jgi:hypothetical protein
MALNGTVFNSRSTGYRVLPVPLPLKQPFHDNRVNSTWQLFLSTYFIEHLTTTLLQEAPFEYYLAYDFFNDTMLNLTTSSLEGFFPLIQTEYGDGVPLDLNFQITDVWNVRSSQADRRLTLNINMRA